MEKKIKEEKAENKSQKLSSHEVEEMSSEIIVSVNFFVLSPPPRTVLTQTSSLASQTLPVDPELNG